MGYLRLQKAARLREVPREVREVQRLLVEVRLADEGHAELRQHFVNEDVGIAEVMRVADAAVGLRRVQAAHLLELLLAEVGAQRAREVVGDAEREGLLLCLRRLIPDAGVSFAESAREVGVS